MTAAIDSRTPSATAIGSVAVRFSEVSKRYSNGHVAVDGIDLDIADGEFFSLLGPSGCGKTSTLRMVGGFEEVTAGTIQLNGQSVEDLPPYKRHVNTVFQSYALFPNKTVYDNVAFGLRRQRVGKKELGRRVHEMLELVELGDFADRHPAQLSGGQSQRVALARALVNRPSVLLLDEPLAALDLRLRRAMQTELKRIQQEVGITFLMVTHDQEEAMSLSDRIAVMNNGRLEQIGAPQQLYEAPATAFVARFLGIGNLMKGTVTRRVGELAECLLECGAVVHVAGEDFEPNDPVQVGIRPERISIGSPDDVAADRSHLAAVIIDRSYVGSTVQYQVTAGDQTLSVHVPNTTELTTAHNWRPGDTVNLSWNPASNFAVR